MTQIFKSEIKVVGFDTTPKNISALKNGQITFLISQKSFNQGYKSIITMVNYLIHKLKPDPEIPTPLEIVIKKMLSLSNTTCVVTIKKFKK